MSVLGLPFQNALFDPQTIANITDVVVSTLGRNARTIGVNPVFVGPLAQAQKVSQVLQPIQATMESVWPIMEVAPEIKTSPLTSSSSVGEVVPMPSF